MAAQGVSSGDPQGSFTKAAASPSLHPPRCHSSLFQLHPTPATAPVAGSLFKEHEVRGLQILSEAKMLR